MTNEVETGVLIKDGKPYWIKWTPKESDKYEEGGDKSSIMHCHVFLVKDIYNTYYIRMS